MEVETRYKSTSRIVEINGNISQGGSLHTLNNPSKVGGRGGTCFGDSGGAEGEAGPSWPCSEGSGRVVPGPSRLSISQTDF
jgi:hypothetical protein